MVWGVAPAPSGWTDPRTASRAAPPPRRLTDWQRDRFFCNVDNVFFDQFTSSNMPLHFSCSSLFKKSAYFALFYLHKNPTHRHCFPPSRSLFSFSLIFGLCLVCGCFLTISVFSPRCCLPYILMVVLMFICFTCFRCFLKLNQLDPRCPEAADFVAPSQQPRRRGGRDGPPPGRRHPGARAPRGWEPPARGTREDCGGGGQAHPEVSSPPGPRGFLMGCQP